MDGLFPLLGIGIVAAIGFMMVRSLGNARPGGARLHDSTSGYWAGGDIAGPSASGSDRSESTGGSSGSSHESSASLDGGGSDSGGGGGGGGSGGGGGD